MVFPLQAMAIRPLNLPQTMVIHPLNLLQAMLIYPFNLPQTILIHLSQLCLMPLVSTVINIYLIKPV